MSDICSSLQVNTNFIVALIALLLLEWFLGKYTRLGSILGMLGAGFGSLVFAIVFICVYVILKIKGDKNG